jgi:ribonuclease T1
VGRRGLTAGGLLAAAALVFLLLNGGDSSNGDSASTTSDSTTAVSTATVSTTAVPADEHEAIGTALATIDAGGPFRHDQDGATFQNREGLLPPRAAGYYKEYTVETPGSDDRGARRLVIGAEGETFYTNDHYDSFIRIDPEDYK